MTPAQFIAKWKDKPLAEHAGYQAFFLDVCTRLGVDPPNDPDNYCFERGATRIGAGHGWADEWKRGHFGWESKGPVGERAHKDERKPPRAALLSAVTGAAIA